MFRKGYRTLEVCRRYACLSLLTGAVILAAFGAQAASVKAYRGQIEIPTYDCWPAIKHPYFKGTDDKNIYPYPMLDNVSLDKKPRTWRTVVLENAYLRITFLPELGGKIHEVIDKTTGQPMFYINHVIKPGLIGQCGAWGSGGVEWNTGPQGHTVSAMQPVHVEILPPNDDGSRSVAIGEVERIYRTQWTVVVTLRPDRSFIEERIRIYNGTETIRPYYFWNCTAVPNTPGFRFIYPMTLGCDHSAEKFFNWPIDHGKDLTRGTNYEDASSIFAWYCDQDFFGSYDDGVDRGVVSYANHHQVPGKKAWTWGQGGYGRMHQMDLTDTDGPYNEVQTGPLLTQGEVGRLDPCEAVTWQEWWYPIHALGGFNFANKNLAANTSIENTQLRLRLLATGTWRGAHVCVLGASGVIVDQVCDLTPARPVEVKKQLTDGQTMVSIEVRTKQGEILAAWQSPLSLPVRKPPERKPGPQSASEFVQAGWQEWLFAKLPEAEMQFQKALDKDPKCAEAHVGLAHLALDSNPSKAADEARLAVALNPTYGPARYILAVAEARLGNTPAALDQAWQAALDPATAVASRALLAKLLIRENQLTKAVELFKEPGPWCEDTLSRNRLALALHELRQERLAAQIVRINLEIDPLDPFAHSINWLGLKPKQLPGKVGPFGRDVFSLLEIVAQYQDLGRGDRAGLLLADLHQQLPDFPRNDLLDYLLRGCGVHGLAMENQSAVKQPETAPVVWPYQYEMLEPLQEAVEQNPQDGKAALLLGHLNFHLGRHNQARELWKTAAKLGASPSIALRALGMASLTLDGKSDEAIQFLTQAHDLDRSDAIVARDLAKVLFKQADRSDDAKQRELLMRVRDTLKSAFPGGRGRSDYVCLLGRAHNRLGEFADTARMLDSVRIKIWEGAREAHDLFEEAHLTLGNEQLKAGRPAEALAEFNRALEYPENLATGKLENTREAHIHYLRGNALLALDKKSEAIAAWKVAAEEPESKDRKRAEARQKAKEALAKALQQ